jgi:hypothetical protein
MRTNRQATLVTYIIFPWSTITDDGHLEQRVADESINRRDMRKNYKFFADVYANLVFSVHESCGSLFHVNLGSNHLYG